jgi:hypothetical protein
MGPSVRLYRRAFKRILGLRQSSGQKWLKMMSEQRDKKYERNGYA